MNDENETNDDDEIRKQTDKPTNLSQPNKNNNYFISRASSTI